MDQGRQGRDQVDAVVMPDVRCERRPASASCARLQSRQFLADARNTGADQGLVADEPEGEADQDRREGGESRTLCRLPDGRGRHPTGNVPEDFAADRRTATAATTSASVRRPMVMRSRARREECVPMPGKMARSAPRPPFGLAEVPVTVGTSASPNGGRGADLAIFPGIGTHSSRRALERMTIGRLTLALVVAAVAVLRSAAKSPGTFAVG